MGANCTLAENTYCTTVHDRAVAVVRERPSSIGGFGPEGGLRVAVAASRRKITFDAPRVAVAFSHFVVEQNLHVHLGPVFNYASVVGQLNLSSQILADLLLGERRFSCRMNVATSAAVVSFLNA